MRAQLLLVVVLAAAALASKEDEKSKDKGEKEKLPPVPLTREITIKQGRLRGIAVGGGVPGGQRGGVEIFLGLPYAAPPVGTQRFMPPGSPPPWPGMRHADSFGPVCPQNPPDISNEREALKAMSAGRYHYLKRLLPYLRNQSEDCLYLNIYAPAQGEANRSVAKHPVLVFIHGESFEWNAGNPYDGSVLASYGAVVVVTINFRLGILGFLKPGVTGNTVANFGLLDQVAALQWVKENIAAFGGDPHSVTLLGHGTGAACANLLLVSPLSQADGGLFHRAILMSGTALSDWAITRNPLKYTIQVAQAVNCPLVERGDELAFCLRRKRLSELLSAPVTAPPFTTPFGPVVDGSVVPNEPHLLMGVYRDLFSRYDLLYGATEIESYHLLDAVSLAYGMLEEERDQVLRGYVTARFERRPDSAFARVLQRYGPGQLSEHTSAEHTRDQLLSILSDARHTAPILRMADLHSQVNPKSYLYVFTHRSKFGDYPGIPESVHGEELPYVFGAPLDGGRFHFHHKFTQPEAALAQTVMDLWTNFAKTGNPNAPRKATFPTPLGREWRHKELDWPEYDATNQTYLRIGIPPDTRRQYKRSAMEFWNAELPQLLAAELSAGGGGAGGAGEPGGQLLRPSPPPPPAEPEHDWTHEIFYPDGPPPPFLFTDPPPHPHHDPSDDAAAADHSGQILLGGAASSVLRLTVILGVLFLFINLVAFSAIYYQRKKLRAQEQRVLTGMGLKAATDSDANEGDSRRPWLLSQNVDSRARVREWIERDVSAENTSTPSPQDSPPKLGLYPATSSASIVLSHVPTQAEKEAAEQRVGGIVAAEALETMRRKRYPRVLPADPPPPSALTKRRSLPPGAFAQLMQPPAQFQDLKPPPPAPPPRTSQLSTAHAHSPSTDESDASTVTVKHVTFDPAIPSTRS